jgi:hypothetical protein
MERRKESKRFWRNDLRNDFGRNSGNEERIGGEFGLRR